MLLVVLNITLNEAVLYAEYYYAFGSNKYHIELGLCLNCILYYIFFSLLDCVELIWYNTMFSLVHIIKQV